VISEEELDLVRSTARGLLGASSSSTLPALGELGLLGLLVSEDRGGAGWCPVEAAVVADEVGRVASIGGASSPDDTGRATSWLAAAVGAAALDVAGDPEDLLPGALDGSAPVVAAAAHLATDGGALRGSAIAVDLPVGAVAVVIIGPDASSFLVGLDDVGVTVRPDPTSIDTTRPLVRIDLDGVHATPLGSATAVRDAAWVLTAATSLGSLRAAVDRLVPYLSERIAFGSPIASFQAIQHRIVDLALLEIRAGVAVDAAARVLSSDPAGASRLAAAAHALAVEHVPPALDECIQLTGGIGFTWEYPLHHELRRSIADGATFGSARQSREVLLEVAGWV
jgi:alkylation response protein AidB-like acyl-CoA dehydrogenase